MMITTGLVDTNTTPKLLRLIEGGRLDPTVFATHRFPLAETEEAYDVFARRGRNARPQGRARGHNAVGQELLVRRRLVGV